MLIKRLAAVMALAGSMASTAQTRLPPQAQRENPDRRQSTNPYARLFMTDQDKLNPAPPAIRRGLPGAPAVSPDTSKTVCGLTVWNVTPDLDPRMLLRRNPDRIDYKIEKLAPAVCRN